MIANSMRSARTLFLLGASAALLLLSGRGPGRATDAARAAEPDPCASPPQADSTQLSTWLKAECYKRPELGYARDKHEKRKTGPTPATAPHGRVTVYYSPQLVGWLRKGRRGPAPDGALSVKEMFDWDSGEFSGRAAMLKQSSGSYSGWFFSPGRYLAAGCIGCHASAISELTFSDLGHIDGTDEAQAKLPGKPSALALASHPAEVRRSRDRARPQPELQNLTDEEMVVPPPSALGLHLRNNPDFARQFPRPGDQTKQIALPFPDWHQASRFVPGAAGPSMFLTSTNCFGCHDAEVPDKSASMVLPAAGSAQFLNISPYAEWSASLMGLSGRDPVFHAQLESEKALRPALSGVLDDLCYRCHGAAGQRQIHLDLGRPFAHQMIYAQDDHPLARYGALARDGVTCTVCHHIAPDGLGQEETMTGQFSVGKPDELFGPYKDAVKALPMKQALGLAPRGGDHMRRSSLCGSCHTVILPQLPAGFRGTDLSDATLARGHEQTTYLEWRNSVYQDEHDPGPEARTCQDCHMPVVAPQAPQAAEKPLILSTKIANIEEFLPSVPSSLPEAEITLPLRRPYARHTLVGINLFVMQMFSQFAGVLGVVRRDPRADQPAFLSSLKLAQREALALAAATAKVELSAAPRIVKERDGTSALVATVRVTNLAGHKFPSGVGFRRAFLEFQVLGPGGRTLWSSGRTSSLGILVGTNDEPLPSEFAAEPAALQRHHQRITRPDQVQIYEERSVDDGGHLTTSFLSLFRRVKDTRLLPKGWSPGAADAESMRPLEPGGRRLYASGQSHDEVTYAVPLGAEGIPAELAAQPEQLKVQATLYYQSIPPYYLRDRFASAKGQETDRLFLFSRGLDTSGALRDWKLTVGTTGPVAVSAARR